MFRRQLNTRPIPLPVRRVSTLFRILVELCFLPFHRILIRINVSHDSLIDSRMSAECVGSVFGCCPDNKTPAGGYNYRGCPGERRTNICLPRALYALHHTCLHSIGLVNPSSQSNEWPSLKNVSKGVRGTWSLNVRSTSPSCISRAEIKIPSTILGSAVVAKSSLREIMSVLRARSETASWLQSNNSRQTTYMYF